MSPPTFVGHPRQGEDIRLVQRNAPSLNFVSDQHYREWIRVQKRSMGPSVSILKFLAQFLMYVGETASLVGTLVLGVAIPTKDNNETYAAIALYIVSWIVSVAVAWANKTRTIKQNGQTNYKKSDVDLMAIIFSFFGILKPVRYAKMFLINRRMLRIIKENSEDKLINEASLKALTDLNSEDLKNKQVELHETFVQTIPMMLLQTYFLLSSNQQFVLCDWGDVSRLTHIGMTIIQAAKCTTVFEGGIANYHASIHFLSFYRSVGAHPLRIYNQEMLSLSGIYNFVCHLATILSCVYPITYFMTVSPLLSLIYLAAIFCGNLALLKLRPQTFLEIQENPPFGVATKCSYYVDRYINIFCNFGTRFGKFSEEIKILNDKKIWFRVPLVLFKIPIYAGTLALIKFGLEPFFAPSSGGKSGVSHFAPTTLNSTFESCPKVENWYNSNEFTKMLGKVLFSVYRGVNDKFQTFNDIFNMAHPLWLFVYVSFVFTLVYAYVDLRRRRRKPATVPPDESDYFDDSYPLVDAYGFWKVLIENVLIGESNNSFGKRKVANRIRKLMLLTVLDNASFYRVTRYCGVIPRVKLSNQKCIFEASQLTDRLTETEEELNNGINQCFQSGHPMTRHFKEMQEKFLIDGYLTMDKKLFFAFFATFDRKLYQMRSDRIARIFKLVGCKIKKYDDDNYDE